MDEKEKQTIIAYLKANVELLNSLQNMIMYTSELIKFYNEEEPKE